ncbi:MAG: efflux RND transporter permease subunit [Myxococcales bacterium]
MRIADIFIRRPVFAVMLVLAPVVFGLLSYREIGVDLYPDVDMPVVTVSVVYPGGDPETMETQVAAPIEEAVNTVSGIKALRSTSMEGACQIVVEFRLDVAGDVAMQDVRDRVATVVGKLPRGARAPVVRKFDVGAEPILSIAVGGELQPRELTRLADKVVRERVQRVDGIGSVDLIGSAERRINVTLDANKLSGLGLTVDDVSSAIRSQNISVPAGTLERGNLELSIKTLGEVKDAAEIADILLPNASYPNVHIRDVAEVTDGVERARSASFLDGRPAIGLVIRKQAGSNAVAISSEVRKIVDELRPRLEAQGATLAIPTDNSAYIARTMHEVQFDLVLGAVLAVVIIMLFLRDLRATLISALALPTSVISTFAVMHWLDFSFNHVTTLALSISVGILIDDAIVVIENIHRHLAQGEPPKQAASNGTAQIFLAVLATTSSILAVFVPVAFMDGVVGRFLYQFGITVSVAVAVSMLVSVVLTPMLSSRFLRVEHGERGAVARAIEAGLSRVDRAYGRMIAWALAHRVWTCGLGALALGLSILAVANVKADFVPPEDRAQFMVNIELPMGASVTTTGVFAERVAADLRQQAPGIEHTFTTVGGGAQPQSNLAQVQVSLTPSRQRAFSQEELMIWARRRLAKLEGAKVTVQKIEVMGAGTFRTQPIQFYLRGSDMEELAQVAGKLESELRGVKGLVDLDTTYRGGKPELSFEVNRPAADALGVPVAAVASTVRGLIAGDKVSQIKDGVDVYDVAVQLPETDKAALTSLDNLQVRSVRGEPVDLGALTRVTQTQGPGQIERQARQRQITVLASLEAMALGEAVQRVEEVARKVVPENMVRGFVGMADTMAESAKSMGIAMFLAVALVYMILASQFDSFSQPIMIMSSLPLSVIGAFGALYLTGQTLSVLVMIGIMMLMGLVTKNAILLVDFANQLRAQGMGVHEALVEAGVTRLRPILMTTAAMVFGMLPVALAMSEGGEVRAPMAISVIGGLLTSTMLTLILVPVAYSLMEGRRGRRDLVER